MTTGEAGRLWSPPWLVWVIVAAGVIALAWAVGGAVSGVARGQLGDFPHFYNAGLATRLGEDIYATAADQQALNRARDGARPYADGGGGYIYPPMLAPVFAPLTLLGPTAAGVVWIAISAGLLVGAMVLAARHFARALAAPRDSATLALGVCLPMVLLADKLKKTFAYLQTDMVVLFPLAAAMALLHRRPVLAGVALAFAANIKYTALIFLPWLLLRGRWHAVGGLAGGAAALALAPALVYGWEGNLGYLGVAFGGLGRMLGLDTGSAQAAGIHPLTWINSVSIPSFAGRLAEAAGGGVGLMAGVVALATGGAVAAAWRIERAHGVATWWRPPARTGDRAADALELAGLVVVAAAFSPQSTSRHFIALLLPLAAGAILLRVARRGRGVGDVALYAGVALVVAGLHLPPGGSAFKAALEGWRWVSGAAWLSLAFYASLLWTGLRYARADAPTALPDGR